MPTLKKKRLLLLFLTALVLRLLLLFYDYSWDINNHIAWAKDLHDRGFQNFYNTRSSEAFATIFPNYPPLSNFIFYLLYPIQSFIEKVAWEINLAIPQFPSKLIFFIQSRSFLAALMKLPAVLADLGIAWLVYLFWRKINSKNRLTDGLIVCFTLFNPAFFYLSSLWGQIDSLPIFFALVAIYLLLFTEKYLASSVFFLLGILTKPTGLVFLPVYLIFFVRKFKTTNFMKSLLACLAVFYLSFILFLPDLKNLFLPFSIFSEKIMAAQSLPFVTNGAFNFWVLLTGFEGIKDTNPFLFGISYRIWGYIITGISVIWILMSTALGGTKKSLDSRFRGNDNSQNFFYATFLIAFASFLFLTKMHERYSLLPLAFLLLAGLKDKKLLRWFIALSLISFLNLYHSWPVPKLGTITDFLYLPLITFILSLINCLIFVILFWGFVMPLRHKNTSRSFN